MFDVCKKEIKEQSKFPIFITLHTHLNLQPTRFSVFLSIFCFSVNLSCALFEYTTNSSTLPVPEPYVREPTDFIPDSEDSSAATSREVKQANISQNNGTAEETEAQQQPKVVSLVCRAHEGQLPAAPYSIKPTQLVSLKYHILMHLIL